MVPQAFWIYAAQLLLLLIGHASAQELLHSTTAWTGETLALSTPLDFFGAKSFCESKGMHLLSLHSAAHVADALNLADPHNSNKTGAYWTGLSRNSNNPDFYYQDGSVVDFLPWASGQPGGSGEELGCVLLGSGFNKDGRKGKIFESKCGALKPALCRRAERPSHTVPDVRQWRTLGVLSGGEYKQFPAATKPKWMPKSRAAYCTRGGYFKLIKPLKDSSGGVSGMQVQCSRGNLLVEGYGEVGDSYIFGKGSGGVDHHRNNMGSCQNGALVGFAGSFKEAGKPKVGGITPVCCPLPADLDGSKWTAGIGKYQKALWNGVKANCTIGDSVVPGIQNGTQVLGGTEKYDVVNLCPATGARNLHISALYVTFTTGDSGKFYGVKIAACKEFYVRKSKELMRITTKVQPGHELKDENWYDVRCQGVRNDYCLKAKWDPYSAPYFACEMSGTGSQGVTAPGEILKSEVQGAHSHHGVDQCKKTLNITAGWQLVRHPTSSGDCIHCDNQDRCNQRSCGQTPGHYFQWFRAAGSGKLESGRWPGKCLAYEPGQVAFFLVSCGAKLPSTRSWNLPYGSGAPVQVKAGNWTSDAAVLIKLTQEGSNGLGGWVASCAQNQGQNYEANCGHLSWDLSHADVYSKSAANRSLVLQEPQWCKWDIARCTPTGELQYLSIPAREAQTGQEATGTVNVNIFKFRALRAFAAKSGRIGGELPAIGDSKLQRPSTIRSLDFRKSLFNGSLPADWVGQFAAPELRYVNVRGNNIKGAIPSAWLDPALTNLTVLVDKPINKDHKKGLCIPRPYVERLYANGTAYNLVSRFVKGNKQNIAWCGKYTLEWRFSANAIGAGLNCSAASQQIILDSARELVVGLGVGAITMSKCAARNVECYYPRAGPACTFDFGVQMAAGKKRDKVVKALKKEEMQAALVRKGLKIAGVKGVMKPEAMWIKDLPYQYNGEDPLISSSKSSTSESLLSFSTPQQEAETQNQQGQKQQQSGEQKQSRPATQSFKGNANNNEYNADYVQQINEGAQTDNSVIEQLNRDTQIGDVKGTKEEDKYFLESGAEQLFAVNLTTFFLAISMIFVFV